MEIKTFKSIITSLSFEGHGICENEGKVFFITDAWPGDEVLVQVTKEKKNFGFGEIKEFITKSKERIQPACEYQTLGCGGCPWMDKNYDSQVIEKEALLLSLTKRFKIQTKILPMVRSSETNFKNRVQLHSVDGKIGFKKRKSSEIVEIDKCLIANSKVNALIKSANENKKKFGSKIYIDERMSTSELLNQKNYGFNQSHHFINNKLKKIIKRTLTPMKNKLAIELFCGQGNYTKTLSSFFESILAMDTHTGSLKTSEGLRVIKKDLYKDYSIDKSFKDADLLFLDPPRSGFKNLKSLCNKLENLKDIIYVSCNPSSALQDISTLEDFDVQFIQGLDAYPHTSHLELIIHLKKK